MLYEDVSEEELCIYYHAVQTYVVHDRVDAEDSLWTSQILFDLKCSGGFRLSINRNRLVLCERLQMSTNIIIENRIKGKTPDN